MCDKADILRDFAEMESRIQELSEMKEAVIVGVAGGSCSGKSLISRILANAVGGKVLSMDDYYRGIEFAEEGNFDKPQALDLELLKRHLVHLRKGKPVRKPIYDFRTHARYGYETFDPAKVTILEGLFALHEIICSELDVKIFVEADAETCLKRRIERDIRERRRTAESVAKQFAEIVQPMYRKYVEPERKAADYIVTND